MEGAQRDTSQCSGETSAAFVVDGYCNIVGLVTIQNIQLFFWFVGTLAGLGQWHQLETPLKIKVTWH